MPKKLLLCMVIIGLTACASGPSPSTSDSTVPISSTPVLQDIPSAANRSAAEWLERAAASSGSERSEALLQAALQLQKDAAWQASAAVIAQLQRYQSELALSAPQQHLLTLLEARFAAHQQRWPYVDALLKPLLQPRQATDYGMQTLELALTSAIAQRRWVIAAELQLQLLEQPQYQASAGQIWSVLQHLPEPAAIQPPAGGFRNKVTAGWLRLVQHIHASAIDVNDTSDETGSQVSLLTNLQQWQAEFADHPATAVANELMSDYQAGLQRANLGQQQAIVLLPLSGQYRSQGQAVRDGIVKALAAQPQLSARFIDSNGFDFATLPGLLETSQTDLIIGPLLKDKVAEMSKLELPEQLRWLTLNELEQGLDNRLPGQSFFALDTETEVRQAAAHIAAQGFKQPLVLAPATNRGEHLANEFAQAWLEAQPDQVEAGQGRYTNTEEMKTAVQDQLGVTTSEARIWQVKIAAGKIIVDSQSRSRADIDAIYLVGGIEQTRLLKPFIDVNISPFMQAIPVYANSSSHTLNNDLSENDLNGVHFTDAEWLIPGHAQQQQLQQLLSQRSDWGYSHARLAAFGHDAVLLAQQLSLLQRVPGLSLTGLTGRLHIDQGRVQRDLAWASYQGHEVIADND
ncbi:MULTISPECIES: penicillin-binding protein activator [Pseudidiomarina]|uniref:Penicillin-binding protein activator LpoA n=2 Tax=Pseudidiomarina TaxID=2800384 RepID=A0A368UVN1_9GAMM|nr:MULTISPECIES: penicillin-binding protein activator [Pseudidiomarina]PWW13017.1 hypothetical protein DET45_10748 [Pseudidiomarina maritima]RBP90449.1 hypothetical protein DFO81_10767 [Pseudidiomarina tainanensis]RCW32125.1 hypothetical protein DFO79_10767 [Pseudidiomarina tainanensis]